jgi:heme-degrading monooxygenase HmoA
MTVRIMVSTTITPDDREAFERAFLEVSRTVRGTPGHVRDELLRDTEGNGYVLLAEWESEKAFRAWEDDPVHRHMAAPLHQYWAGGGVVRTIYEVAADGG